MGVYAVPTGPMRSSSSGFVGSLETTTGAGAGATGARGGAIGEGADALSDGAVTGRGAVRLAPNTDIVPPTVGRLSEAIGGRVTAEGGGGAATFVIVGAPHSSASGAGAGPDGAGLFNAGGGTLPALAAANGVATGRDALGSGGGVVLAADEPVPVLRIAAMSGLPIGV